jgi:hypothetical protein
MAQQVLPTAFADATRTVALADLSPLKPVRAHIVGRNT